MDKECEYFSNSKSSASGCCLVFAGFFANFNLALLKKVLLIKKTWMYLSKHSEMGHGYGK